MPSRRDFLKKCGGAIALVTAPSMLENCTSGISTFRGQFDGETIVIPKIEAIALQQPNGLLQVQAQYLPIRIVLRNVPEKGYIALSTVCTHSGCEVRTMPASFQCPCHGSEYDAEGNVIGGPAQRPLQRFIVIEKENEFIIKVKT
ncbi:MAG: ubiquinol-cytochrome c reductase iron-sulfur subunit [bacterium]